MLTEQERREIAHEMAMYPSKRAVVVEALKVVQRHRGGWVSDEGLRDVAALLAMTPDEVEDVATFYNMVFRSPVGRHVILLCDSVSCCITGYDGLRDWLRARLQIDLGETTPDGRFTLLPVACLGACDRAPAMMIDTDLHGPLTPETLEQVLAQYP